jgi:hypothetical protein
MVHREPSPRPCKAAAALALVLATLIAAPAGAGSITTLTGNVEVDFPAGASDVITLVNPRYPTNNPEAYIASHNLSTGWSIKDIRLSYDKAADVMYVGVNFFGIAGDADSNGNPGTVSAAAAAHGAIDVAHLGGRESITLGFDMTNSGSPGFLAGVPGDKSTAGAGLNGFTIAEFTGSGLGLANSYGAVMSNQMGGLFFDPSAANPDFEFAIRNFSKVPGYDPTKGFGLIAFAGTPDDTYEEEGALFPRVGGQQVPEPASLVGWAAFAAAGAVWRLRRRSRARS